MPSVATATATMQRTFGEACQVNPQDPFKSWFHNVGEGGG